MEVTASEKACFDAAAIAAVKGTAIEHTMATGMAFLMVQRRRHEFGPPIGTPFTATEWTEDDRAFYAGVLTSALEGAATKVPRGALPDPLPIGAAAITLALTVMQAMKNNIPLAA